MTIFLKISNGHLFIQPISGKIKMLGRQRFVKDVKMPLASLLDGDYVVAADTSKMPKPKKLLKKSTKWYQELIRQNQSSSSRK